MQTLYLLNYNNYYNHRLYYPQSLETYLSHLCSDPIANFNFAQNDGVDVSVTINNMEGSPDYCVVADGTYVVASRWFVLDSVKQRNGQYTIRLHRDVLADYYDKILDAPLLVERGMLNNNDSYIINSEPLVFNKIKKSQKPLYDASKSAWIVAYSDLNNTDNHTITATSDTSVNPLGSDVYTILHAAESTPNKHMDVARIVLNTAKRELDSSATNMYYGYIRDDISGSGDTSGITTKADSAYSGYSLEKCFVNTSETDRANAAIVWGNIANAYNDSTYATNRTAILNEICSKTGVSLTDLKQYDNRYVKDSNDNIYFVTITEEEGTTSLADTYSPTDSTVFYNNLQTIVEGADEDNDWLNVSGDYLLVIPHYYTQTVTLTLQSFSQHSAVMDFSTTKKRCADAPYYMMTCEYNDINLNLMIDLKKQFSTHIYDIQILPYCPVQQYVSSTAIGKIDVTNLTENLDYINITVSSTAESRIVFAPYASFKVSLNYNISVTDRKKSKVCEKYVLCGPNGNGTFEFAPALFNDGLVNGFSADCTYKPISPFVLVRPNFSGFYGDNYQDFRGLVLGGDFSIPLISDNWSTYEANNKNYASIFAKQTDLLETQNKWAKAQDITGVFTGAISSAGSGAMLGGMAGGIGGAVVGGVAGAVGGLATGALDAYANEEIRQKSMDVRVSTWNMTNENIKAQAYNLINSGCLTLDNTLVPFIEYYTCSDAELEAYDKFIKYQGMTVGRVDTLANFETYGKNYAGYFNRYFKAKVIMIDISDDTHIANAINEELNKGVYI